MVPKLSRKTVAILAIIAFVILVIISLFLISGDRKAKNPNLDSGKYYDKNSGQTVSNPPGKTPDTYGVPSGKPIYLGIDAFLDQGLTLDQLNRLKYAFENYFTQSKQNIKEVSINVNSISAADHLPNTANFSRDFKVTFDRKDNYNAKVEYSHLKVIRLHLYNPQTNVQIYDSGSIGENPGE